jgi:hypothetical protein
MKAVENLQCYQNETRAWRDNKVKPKHIKDEDLVLLQSLRMEASGKLELKCIGPFMVTEKMLKRLISIVLHNIVVAHQQISGILDARLKFGSRLISPDNGIDLWHQHHSLRHGRLFCFHFETKLFAKRSQATSEKLFHSIMTSDDRSHLNKSRKVSLLDHKKKELPSNSLIESSLSSAGSFLCLKHRLFAP